MSTSSSCYLDSSVILRYLTRDPEEMFETARQIIDSNQTLQVTNLVLAESAYVLSSFYEVNRADIVSSLVGLISKRNIVLDSADKPRVIEALELCRGSNRVSFVDALLWVSAITSDAPCVYSFDKRFPKSDIALRDS